MVLHAPERLARHVAHGPIVTRRDKWAHERRAVRWVRSAEDALAQPVALLVPPKIFSAYKKKPVAVDASPAHAAKPTREEAIGVLLADVVGPTDAVVCTTGFTSREVYELRARLGQHAQRGARLGHAWQPVDQHVAADGRERSHDEGVPV